MSKYERLCRAYAKARQEVLEASRACQEFARVFSDRFGEYIGCAIEYEEDAPDERGGLSFYIILRVYPHPETKDESESEIVRISLSVERVIDNYVVTLFPWGQDFKLFWNEFDKFDRVYDYIFDRVLETYTCGFEALSPEKEQIRNLGWGF